MTDLDSTQRFMTCLLSTALASQPWKEPHVSDGDDGSRSFEWWNGARKVTVWFDGKTTAGLLVWGPDIVEQMISFHPVIPREFRHAWHWLWSDTTAEGPKP